MLQLHFINSKISLAIVIFMMVVADIIVEKYFYITNNISASEPVGKYLIFPYPIRRGQLRVICLSSKHKPYMDIMSKIGLQKDSNSLCNNSYTPLMKQIIGVPGDEVSITSRGVMINGILIPETIPFNRIGGINLQPILTGYKRILLKDEYWVRGIGNRSYDSRYFGVIFNNEIGGNSLYLGKLNE